MQNKRIKGITLIALVITIIVLLILAGVTLSLTLGENGLLNHTEMAEEENQKQTATEMMQLKITTIQMQNYTQKQKLPNLQELSEGLCADEEIEYVSIESQKLASLDKINVGESKSIFTKIKQYPYEFEIDSSLKLASINGVKIASNSDKNSKKEILWKTDEIGVQTVELEKNISDYDFIMVYCASLYSSQELIFDTSESYEQQLNYANNGNYIINTIKLDLEKNCITMSTQSRGESAEIVSGNCIKKIIGIKL